jgi:hypothetical protein
MTRLRDLTKVRKIIRLGKLSPGLLVLFMGIVPSMAEALTLTRSIDGSGNNLTDSALGSVGEHLLRGSPGAPDPTMTGYADDISEPARGTEPSPRVISNTISVQSETMPSARGLSAMLWYWGQWIDHDLSLTHIGSSESLPIQVPADDPHFDPSGTGTATIDFDRSKYDVTTGDHLGNPRQQVNEISAWIDASNVYGSDPVRARALQELDIHGAATGRLRVTSTAVGDLLPYNTIGLENASLPMQNSADLFLAGDIRANEQAGLTAMHTLFAREHNRLADQFAALDPLLTGDEIYERARKVVGAELQQITYNEFLPALLGNGALSSYTGYDSSVNPNIANLFSTAAFRVGHTMLNPVILRLDDAGNTIPEGDLALRDAYFNPANIESVGIEPYLKGAAEMYSQEIDTHIVDDVRNFLFGAPGSGGFDLASLNIQRGRDHGLPDYNTARDIYGLSRVTQFSEISSDQWLQQALAAVYGSVDEIDPWVGMLAEDHVAGASVGELLRTIIADQFERLRDGDRFWFEADPFFTESNPDLLAELRDLSFADVIMNNTSLTSLDSNVFFTGSISEPSSLLLLLGSVFALAAVKRRKRRLA